MAEVERKQSISENNFKKIINETRLRKEEKENKGLLEE